MFTITIIFSAFVSCGSNEDNDDENNEINEIDCNCLTNNDKTAQLEYDYMFNANTGDSFYTFKQDRINKIVEAFHDRARI